jgi:hypothetical protein
MNGEDTEWIDYAQIDQNSEYDDKEMQERESEDKWFADDEPPQDDN